MKPNDAVGSAITILGEGLDLHIEMVMKPEIGELEWPAVLQELDAHKGKIGYIYSRKDVAMQLRMVTERLGNLGYPFDDGDHNRTMSSFGGILRIYRKRWAHNDEFSHFEATHLIDTVRIVMGHIGDTSRAAEVAQLHAGLVKELIADEPAAVPAAATGSQHLVTKSPGSNTASVIAAGAMHIPAEPRVTGIERIRGNSREVAWEPWEVSVMGDCDVLDTMRTKTSKERVRAVIEDIVDAEAPIQIERLAKLVGYAFGLSRVQSERVKKINYQVKNSAVLVDSDNFVWPENVDRERWLLYRSCAEGQRRIEQISPVELANATVDLLDKNGAKASDLLRREILASFGRSKTSKQAEAHLDKGIMQARAFERITEVDGVVQLVAR